jgi:1-acyl-sn-glycerol-3-phosphate acyltransferase
MTNDNITEYHDNIFLQFSYSFIRLTLGTLVRLIWVKKVEGIENIPKTGSVIVAFNHQSYFDFLCFISVSPRKIHFLSAEKFFTHPVWGPLVKLTSQIKVEREKHDKGNLDEIILKHLEKGKMIGIFPEGTRSPDEKEMLQAFTGVAKYALRGGVPVLPVGIKGTYEVMAKHDKKPKFKKIVTFHIGKPMHFTEYSHSKLDKKTFWILTDKVMIEIAKLSGKNYSYVGKID